VTFDDREPGASEPVWAPRTPDEVAPPAVLSVPGPRGEADSAASRDRAQ